VEVEVRFTAVAFLGVLLFELQELRDLELRELELERKDEEERKRASTSELNPETKTTEQRKAIM